MKTPEEQEKMDGSPALIDQEHIHIKFQLGPVKEAGVNGCQVDDILDILIARMQGFQRGPFNSREGALVVTRLQEAQHWLRHRTLDREARGVEGQNKA